MRKHSLFILVVFTLVFINVHESYAQGKLSPYEKEGLWGYVDKEGKIIIKPRFIVANDFSLEGIAAVVDDQGWVYIDTKGGNVIRPYVFDNRPDYFQEGLARFTADNKFGFFDKTGKVIIEAQFDFALPFHQGLAAICMECKIMQTDEEHSSVVGGKWGYINKEGKIVIQLIYDKAGILKMRTPKSNKERP